MDRPPMRNASRWTYREGGAMGEYTEVGRADVGERWVIAAQGDLTAQQVGVVVNAANEQLAHGGGVAAALAKKGGPAVQQESDEWVAAHGEVGPGHAAVTTAGDLPADRIVHIVGPRYREGQDNEGLLRQAIETALDTAAAAGARSVAMPAISAGVFGYPRDEATQVIATTARAWLDRHGGPVEEVRLVGFDEGTAQDFAAALS
jgi:putative ATPase